MLRTRFINNINEKLGDELLKEILRLVKSGTKVFSADKFNVNQDEFQDIAMSLIELQNRGFIEFRGKSHRESCSGNNYYDLVSVGSITYKGKQFLNSTQVNKKINNQEKHQ